MRKHKFLGLTLGVCMLMLLSPDAKAGFPTLDFEMVVRKAFETKRSIEQSKFIQKGVKIFGNVSNTIGSTKSSITKFVAENSIRIQKQLDSFNKQSKLMAEAKKTYKEAQSIKAEYDKTVSDYNSYKSEVNKFVATAENTTLKGVVSDVTKGTVVEDVSKEYSSAKNMVDKASENPMSLLNSTGSSGKKYEENSEDEKSISGQMKKFRSTVNTKAEDATEAAANKLNDALTSKKENKEENKEEESKEEDNKDDTQASYSFNSSLMFADQLETDDNKEEEDNDFFPYDKYEGVFFIPLIISERCKMQPQDFANEERTKDCFLLLLENYKSEIQSVAEIGSKELKLANYQMTMGTVTHVFKRE